MVSFAHEKVEESPQKFLLLDIFIINLNLNLNSYGKLY